MQRTIIKGIFIIGILFLVVVLFGIPFLLSVRTGAVDSNTPVIGPVAGAITPSSGATVLIIGSPSNEVLWGIENNKPIISRSIVRTVENVAQQVSALEEMDIIILDQSGSSEKTIPHELADGLQAYVKMGGKLVIIGETDIASLGTIIPIECNSTNELPSCEEPIQIISVLFRQDDTHPIMKGIERVPAESGTGYLGLNVMDVTSTGNTIAYLEDVKTQKEYPAIIEKTFLGGGSVVYTNYNVGITPNIFRNMISYLK